LRRLLFNPEVTVRMRGVMEKCTFCVQRIQNAKIHAKAVRRSERPGEVDAPLPDGEVVTACQQACPTEAIVFGDLSDPNSRVSRLHADQRHYDLLPEVYTKPRNKYLARVTNPHPVALGLGHHQLRLLGRHRPRRHADLRGPLPVPPEVAHRRSTASPRR
jgi:Fe-S-cluster-containing dehydrogenase component